MELFDAIIIGHGPAGCSAALYLCRAGKRVVVVGKDRGALGKAEMIQNYYGLTMRGRDLVAAGQKQCAELGAQMVEDEVLSLEWLEDGAFEAQRAGGEAITAKTALLATGKVTHIPNIEGIRDFEGRGVSYCAVCDAFLYRGREVAVLGGGAYARHEMEELLPLAKKVTLFTQGAEPEFDPPREVRVLKKKLLRLHGEDTLSAAEMEDGRTQDLAGLFVALGTASAGDLARKLGLRLKNNAVPVGTSQETTLPGLFAAGDCTGSFAQVAFAVAEGAKAGLGMIAFLRNNA